MKKVIMTGGTGFIGTWLIKELMARGIEITVLTSDIAKLQIDNPLVKVIYIDYNKVHLLSEQITGTYDAFYHLGWNGVGGRDKNNISLQLANITVSIEILKLAEKLGCRVFIAAGTVAEYVFNKDVIDFSLRQTPNDIYGATKVSVHYLLETMARQMKQNMIWVVLPSTFGEGRKEDNIISYTITSLLRRQKPQYGSLTQMWDFLYVSEVARALIDIGEKGRYNTTYGIGSGEFKPLKTYMEIIRDMIDPTLPLGINELSIIEEQPTSSCVNIDHLRQDIGFEPMVSFEEGMSKTIEYYRRGCYE